MDIRKTIMQSVEVKQQLLKDEQLLKSLASLSEAISQSFRAGGKLLICGNGGSAADAQHMAAELSGRFNMDRPPLFAEALHVNTSYLTAVANDYGYDQIFARMVKAAGKKGDILLGISTSGNSPNVVNAIREAKNNQMTTAAFTGMNGGKITQYADYTINVPSNCTPRIQEAHGLLGHIVCQWIEEDLFGKE